MSVRQLEDLPLLVGDVSLLRADAPLLPDDDHLPAAGHFKTADLGDPPVMPLETSARFSGLRHSHRLRAGLPRLVPVASRLSSLLRGFLRCLSHTFSPPCDIDYLLDKN